ncbi:BrnA antitoxin family protein [Sphingomonas echinoides]|uniref:BrnA antitoxin family protein n=1 Tax=Sphingomonas TaxID=13687 RepID=UPI001AEAF5E0
MRGGRLAAPTLRLHLDVIERFRPDGPGWQGRMNAALRKAVGLYATLTVSPDRRTRCA